MSTNNACDIHTITDLVPFIMSNKSQSMINNNRIRGLIIVSGGGGKTTLVNSLQSSEIPCADIDHYWNDKQEEQQETVVKLVNDWKNACKDNNLILRHKIEDEYVILKANLSKEKWSYENTFDILFVQTCRQSSILMDNNSFSLNLLPTNELHHSNLYSRAASRENPPDDFDVCIRQWKENEEYGSYVLYHNFEQFQNIIFLFHQFILSKR